jgi:hypothetical protein
LIELLVVITIIVLISAVALPVVIPALSHRQVSEAARILQGAIVGARDSAIKNNAPTGIRLLPDPVLGGIGPATYNGMPNPYAGIIDPAQPLACNRIIPIAAAPDYNEGVASAYPGSSYVAGVFGSQPANVLVLEEGVGTWTFVGNKWVYLPNNPTSWFWNVRVGDKVQINGVGTNYTVIGPLNQNPATGNNEWFVNVGPPGTGSPITRTVTAPDGVTQQAVNPEYLLLVNGIDDNKNGWIDQEWDGVDNNNFNGIDDPTEWTTEAEIWQGAAIGGFVNKSYTIKRRAAPTINAREVLLPSNVVIDLTTALPGSTQERSRLPLDPYAGYVDILVYPNGSIAASTLYSSPSAFGMNSSFYHFWLAERSDVVAPIGTVAPSLPLGTVTSSTSVPPYTGPTIKGQYYLLTLFARTGNVTALDSPAFSNPNGTYFAGLPYVPSQQGAR